MDVLGMNSNAGIGGGGDVPWGYLVMGLVLGGLIAFFVYLTVDRADTRPVREYFVSQPVKGSTGVPCGQVSSEAESLYQMFASRKLDIGEEADQDLADLRRLLGKLCCFKRDLMSPGQTVAATKEVGFATHMDIQPLADTTARCFSKTIPERDLDIQFEKWSTFGKDMIRRLCTAGSLTESETAHAESLLNSLWKDVYDVAKGGCLGKIAVGPFATSPRDPAPMTPETLQDLRPYDGPGARY